MSNNLNKGILIDRDGVLIENRPDYVRSVREVELIKGSDKAVAMLLQAGYTICVVTNQGGVAKGFYLKETVEEIHRHIARQLEEKSDVTVTDKMFWYFCPHRDEDLCSCRKPQPGMLKRAISEHNFSASNTWMVGDSIRDIAAGTDVGCHTALLETGLGKEQTFSGIIIPKMIFPDFLTFVEYLLHEQGGNSSNN